MARIDVLTSSKAQDWATPRKFVKQANEEFWFVMDACATIHSRVVPVYAGPGHEDPCMQDALQLDWYATCQKERSRVVAAYARGEELTTQEQMVLHHDRSNLPPTVWMNPPYGRSIKHFISAARRAASRGCTVVALTYARTETKWWNQHIPGHASEVRFVKGRMTFLHGESMIPADASATAGNALIVWHPWKPAGGRTVHSYIDQITDSPS